MKDPTTGWIEADISINGVPLTFSQSMTVRVALESFDSMLLNKGLGDDETGLKICKGYLDRLAEVRTLMVTRG